MKRFIDYALCLLIVVAMFLIDCLPFVALLAVAGGAWFVVQSFVER